MIGGPRATTWRPSRLPSPTPRQRWRSPRFTPRPSPPHDARSTPGTHRMCHASTARSVMAEFPRKDAAPDETRHTTPGGRRSELVTGGRGTPRRTQRELGASPHRCRSNRSTYSSKASGCARRRPCAGLCPAVRPQPGGLASPPGLTRHQQRLPRAASRRPAPHRVALQESGSAQQPGSPLAGRAAHDHHQQLARPRPSRMRTLAMPSVR